MPLWGIDISHYQGDFDLARARADGFEFAILKATEGHSYTDPWFTRNLGKARSAGLLVAAYHYQRSGSSPAAQAGHIASVVPRDVPVILDVEAGGGSIGHTRATHAAVEARGYHQPLIYLPAWYWRQIGSPSLAGLPPLWYSRYANNRGGTASQIWNRAASWFAQFWAGYGGLPVAVLQFTSSATVAGHTPVDANAFRGSRADLAALLAGGTATHTPVEDDMQLDDTYQDWAGNEQTVQGTWNRWDRKLWAIEQALLHPEPSRVPGAEHIQVPLTDAVRDTNGVAYQLPGMITGQQATITKMAELLASQQQLDVAAVKTAVAEALAEGTVNVDVSVSGSQGGDQE